MAPATEQSEYGLALARGVREASEEQAPDYGASLVRGVIEARSLGQLPGLPYVDDWAGEELDDTSAQACASSSEASGRPDPGEAPGQAAQLDERGACEASTSEAIEQARQLRNPLSSEPIDLGANDLEGMSSGSGDNGRGGRTTTVPPQTRRSDHRPVTLGTVQDHTQPEPPVLIPQHGSTGGRKPYNVRLRLDLVAEAMDKPQSQGLSLAGLIEQLLEGYVAEA
jgi:hypothetical protein